MKIFSRILAAIYILTGLLTVFLLALCWVKPEIIKTGKSLMENNIPMLGVAGFTLIIVGIIWLVYWFDYVVLTKNISFDNPHGRVKISLRAIEEFIGTKISVHIKNIKAMRVKAVLGTHGLETVISLKVPSGYNIPELAAQIQELIKNYLQDVIGVERISHIQIIVTNILTVPEPEPHTENEEKTV